MQFRAEAADEFATSVADYQLCVERAGLIAAWRLSGDDRRGGSVPLSGAGYGSDVIALAILTGTQILIKWEVKLPPFATFPIILEMVPRLEKLHTTISLASSRKLVIFTASDVSSSLLRTPN